MLPVNTVFPEFVPDQLLTSADLNELFGYLDEQGRMTRTNLIGIGIVCGLEITFDATNNTITISKGTGVTSQGYLITVPSITYAEYNTYDAVKEIYYDRFVNTTTKTQKINLWELKQANVDPNATDLTSGFLADKVVLLFVELLEEKNKNCDPNSCDDKGVHVTVTFRPLLVTKTDAVTLIGGAGGALAIDTFTGLPEIKMARFDVPNTAPVTSQDIFNAYAAILNTTFLSAAENALTQAYTRFGPFVLSEFPGNPFAGLAANFGFINNGTITTNQLQHIQYYFDLFSDFLLAYEEFRKTGSHILSTCCPDDSLFPRHLLLGEAIPLTTGIISTYRHYFIYSPLFDERDLLAELKLLFKRLVLLMQKFVLPPVSSSSTTTNLDTNIRITPSTLGNVPLSAKAIPYYYDVVSGTSPLYKNWSYQKTVLGIPQRNLSYNAIQYNTTEDFVKAPLKYDLEPYNFLRIEGIIGKPYTRVLQNIKYQINQYRLPVDVIALNTDNSRLFQGINTNNAFSFNFQGSLSGLDLLNMLCHFQDLEALYDAMKNEMLCILCKELKYYYERPLTLLNLPAPPNNPPAAASVVGLFNYCSTTSYIVRPDTIGYYIEKINSIVGDTGNVTLQVVAQALGLQTQLASGFLASFDNSAFTYLVVFFEIPIYIIRLANTLTSTLASFDPDEYCNTRDLLAQRAEVIKYLVNVEVTGTTSSSTATNTSASTGNTITTNVALTNRIALFRAADVNSAAPTIVQQLFTAEDMSDHLNVLIYNCKCSAFKGLKAEYLKRAAQLTLLRQFGYFTTQHPGIQHKAGVPMGGTFIVVYHTPQNTITNGSATGKFKISGRLLDQSGAVIPGVALQVKDTTRSAVTDAKGNFSMPVTELPATLVVRGSSVTNQEVVVTSETPADIQIGNTQDTTSQTPINAIAAGTVIADFYLPYRCCSDCPPIQYIVPDIKDQPPANQGPVANAGADQTITLPTSTVTLDGSASTDPDGSITKYEWMKLSGPGTPVIVTPNSAQTSVTGLVQGTYEFELTVTDNSNNIARDSMLVTVNPAPPPQNLPPVANAGPDKTITISAVNAPLVLDGSASSDPDGTIASFAWQQVSGPNTAVIVAANLVQTPVTGLVEGVYEFKLTVTDNQGASASDNVVITAKLPDNQPPVANAGADQTITLPTNTITLDGSASNDPDGTITAYTWSVVSGPGSPVIGSPNAKTTQVSGLAMGNYTFALKVTDDRGASATDQVAITVNAQPKTCSPLGNVINLFGQLSTVDPQLFPVFTGGGFTSYKDVSSYFDLLNKDNVVNLPVDKQIDFFATAFNGRLINDWLASWLEALNGLILSSDFRLLALALYRILVQLAMYIACIQADDIDKAKVSMVAVFKLVTAHTGQWKAKTASFFTAPQLAIIKNIGSDMGIEVTHINSNGEATTKALYLSMLQDIIKIIVSI